MTFLPGEAGEVPQGAEGSWASVEASVHVLRDAAPPTIVSDDAVRSGSRHRRSRIEGRGNLATAGIGRGLHRMMPRSRCWLPSSSMTTRISAQTKSQM